MASTNTRQVASLFGKTNISLQNLDPQYLDQQKYLNSPVCSPSQYKCAEEKLDYLDGVSKILVSYWSRIDLELIGYNFSAMTLILKSFSVSQDNSRCVCKTPCEVLK